MYVGKEKGVYPTVENLKGASLGSALALLANNSPGREGMPGTDALAYCKNPQITSVKSFIGLAPQASTLTAKPAGSHAEERGNDNNDEKRFFSKPLQNLFPLVTHFSFSYLF